MATLVCFWKVRCSQEVTKTHCFYLGKFQSQVSFARLVLVLFEGHVHPEVAKTTVFTEGMRTASVEHNVCLCFHRCVVLATCCLSAKFNRSENVDVLSVFDQRDEVQETLPAAVFIQTRCSHSRFSVTAWHLILQPRCQPRCQRSRARRPVQDHHHTTSGRRWRARVCIATSATTTAPTRGISFTPTCGVGASMPRRSRSS